MKFLTAQKSSSSVYNLIFPSSSILINPVLGISPDTSNLGDITPLVIVYSLSNTLSAPSCLTLFTKDALLVLNASFFALKVTSEIFGTAINNIIARTAITAKTSIKVNPFFFINPPTYT